MKTLIDKYIKRIKIDYPEDDKLMIDLQDLLKEDRAEQLRLCGVVGQSEQLLIEKSMPLSEQELREKNCPKHRFAWDKISPPWEKEYCCSKCGKV